MTEVMCFPSWERVAVCERTRAGEIFKSHAASVAQQQHELNSGTSIVCDRAGNNHYWNRWSACMLKCMYDSNNFTTSYFAFMIIWSSHCNKCQNFKIMSKIFFSPSLICSTSGNTSQFSSQLNPFLKNDQLFYSTESEE